MSYDLYLRPKNAVLSKVTFETYFNKRRCYSVSGDEVYYNNQDTGVTFSIDYSNIDSDDKEEYPISFNMGYFRPSYFGREASLELADFVSKFNLEVDDPQINGMGVGEYDEEKFISGWLSGNELAFKCMPSRASQSMKLPKEKLEYAWEWNYKKHSFDGDKEKVFIPTIMVLDYEGNAVTSCIWPESKTTRLPDVDYVMLGSDIMYLEDAFDFEEGEVSLIKLSNIKKILTKYQKEVNGEHYYIYESDNIMQNLTSVTFDYIERKPLYEIFSR